MDLAGRLKALVERDFGGNYNRAVTAWGVPQPTLHRYLAGKTRAPNARSLLKIARFYGTTVEWLLEGVGFNPLEVDRPWVQVREWEQLVASLGLKKAEEWVIRGVPGGISAAYFTLGEWGLESWTGKQVSLARSKAALDARWRASVLELEAWTILLRGMIASYGRMAVRNKLLSLLDRARLGFQPFATVLLESGVLPQDLAARYDRFRPAGQPMATTQFTTSPTLPPLQAAQWRQPRD